MAAVDYSTFVSTTFGAVLALGGALLGQGWNERRSVAREQRAWEREDRQRTFDDRRKACVDFYEFAEALSTALSHGTVMGLGSDPDSLKDRLFRLSALDGGLDLFTSLQTRLAAGEVYRSLLNLSTRYLETIRDPIPDTPEGVDRRVAMVKASEFLVTQAALKEAIRKELGIVDHLFS